MTTTKPTLAAKPGQKGIDPRSPRLDFFFPTPTHGA